MSTNGDKSPLAVQRLQHPPGEALAWCPQVGTHTAYGKVEHSKCLGSVHNWLPGIAENVTTNDFQGETILDLLRVLLAILLPPLGVFLQVGFGGQFWLNILLTLCGYIPGIVHAVWIIAKR